MVHRALWTRLHWICRLWSNRIALKVAIKDWYYLKFWDVVLWVINMTHKLWEYQKGLNTCSISIGGPSTYMFIVSATYIATIVFYFLEHILNSDILQNCSSGKRSLDQRLCEGYYIRLYHLVIGWHTWECNIGFGFDLIRVKHLV